MISVPPQPMVPDEQRDRTEVTLRHSDLAQDGRVQVAALLHGVSATVWEHLLAPHPASMAMREQGVVPVATRLTAEGTGGPFGVFWPYTVNGAYQLAHTVGKGGDVERIMIRTWAEFHGPNGHFFAPTPPLDAPRVLAGRVAMEQVFTRIFAKPEDRRMTRLELPGFPAVPPDRVTWTPPESLLALPEGAIPLEAGFAPDSAPTVFGLRHTDANQHVSVLMYPQLFEEAALRRFAALGKSARLLARFMDVGYRKPSVAGDNLRIVLQAFALGERLGAVGAFVTEEEARLGIAAARPRCFVKMVFES